MEPPYLGFSLFARSPVRLPCWRTILAYLGFGHAYQHHHQRRYTSGRRGGTRGTRVSGEEVRPSKRETDPPLTVDRGIILVSKTSVQVVEDRGLSSWASNSGGKRARHAGRYWRFVQVARRPGRRRVQKHDDRRPNTDHRTKRPRECEEGFQFRLAQGRAEEKGPSDRGPPWERLDRLKVMPYTILSACTGEKPVGR